VSAKKDRPGGETEALVAAVKRALAKAPPLTEAQRLRVAELLKVGGAS
jgi:hypothetical protein